jgi:hypothetical protein
VWCIKKTRCIKGTLFKTPGTSWPTPTQGSVRKQPGALLQTQQVPYVVNETSGEQHR